MRIARVFQWDGIECVPLEFVSICSPSLFFVYVTSKYSLYRKLAEHITVCFSCMILGCYIWLGGLKSVGMRFRIQLSLLEIFIIILIFPWTCYEFKWSAKDPAQDWIFIGNLARCFWNWIECYLMMLNIVQVYWNLRSVSYEDDIYLCIWVLMGFWSVIVVVFFFCIPACELN